MTRQESEKLRHLLLTYLLVYDTWKYHDGPGKPESLIEQADQSGWIFDWEPVLRYCSPELYVVWSADRRDSSRFPSYVVVPGAGEWFELHSDPEQLEWLLSDAVPIGGDAEVVESTLETLRKTSTSLPTERRGEAMKHLNAWWRIVKPTL